MKPASSGMRSVSLSSWHKGGSSSATTSSMWCLTSSLLRYWPLGQCFIFRFSSITYSSLKALHVRSVRFENLKVLYVLLDKSRLSVTLKKEKKTKDTRIHAKAVYERFLVALSFMDKSLHRIPNNNFQ